MGFKMKGMSFLKGQSPLTKLNAGGKQQGPVDNKQLKLQKSENPDTYVYKAGKGMKEKYPEFVKGQKISGLEDRAGFIDEDVNASGKKMTSQQKKDKSNIKREADIMRAQKKKTVPFKKHVKGHKNKEDLIKEGFTPADADRMIKDGATTGKPKPAIKPSYKPVKVKPETTGKMQVIKKKEKKKPSQGDFVPAYAGADYSKEQIAKMTKAERKRKID